MKPQIIIFVSNSKHFLKSVYCIFLCIIHSIWLPQHVRYSTVRSLQSAGEVHSGAAGYQTDKHNDRAGNWRTCVFRL